MLSITTQGDLDIYVVNTSGGKMNKLFKNNGDGDTLPSLPRLCPPSLLRTSSNPP